MTRRAFCSTTLAAGASFGATKRPNVLFCFSDDWGRYASAYRQADRPGLNDILDTPVLDRIGREGVIFDNAFVAAPSCTPSRAALSCGMYFFRCGRHANLRIAGWQGHNPYDDWPGFPNLLAAAGYHVGHAGKTTSKKNAEPKQKTYIAGQTPMSRFSQNAVQRGKAAIYDEVRSTFRTFLSERGEDQPFLYWFGPHNSHRPWARGSGAKLWDLDPNALEGRIPKFLPDHPVVREDVADYLGEALAWDAMIGVLVEELERIGELDNTLIILSGDHGMPGVTHGKCNVYDFGVHAPLLIRWGERVPPGRRLRDFAQLMDLAPTVVEAAGLEPPSSMQARSLLGLLTSDKTGQIEPKRDFVVVGRERHVPDARPGKLPYPTRAIRTEDYLYIRNFKPERAPMGVLGEVDPSWEELENDTMVCFKDMDAGPTKALLVTRRDDPEIRPFYDFAFGKRPAEELYDLGSDPDQVRNVAGRPEYAEAQAALRARLMAELERAEDPRLGDAFDRPPYVEPDA